MILDNFGLMYFYEKLNRMKFLFVLLLITSFFSNCNTQTNESRFTFDDFERQVIAYEPNQNDLSDKDYNYGVMILSDMKRDVKNDPSNFNLADYFNIFSSFITLKEDEEVIKIAFDKLRSAEGSCEYFLASKMFKSSKYDILREEINNQILACKNATPTNAGSLDLEEYSQQNNLDPDLITLVDKLLKSDEKYRKEDTTDWSKQSLIDKENQRIIDSLYYVHQTYIGKTLVGEEFESVMWSVIQHSNLEMMERYLPIIQKAVADKELNVTPLKMLIDRFYGLKYGYQIFGSQSGFGFELADENKRREIELKYGIE